MSYPAPRTPSAARPRPASSGPTSGADEGADAGTCLAREFRLAWHSDERFTVEQFFERNPLVAADAEVTIELICEEICLRQESGERVDAGELLSRFPQWRAELELLLACDEAFSDQASPAFPETGDELGEFHLVAELGRGATGRVFLATQPSLVDRPVVVKFTSSAAAEHLSLARLQHTGIVPLYLAQDFPAQRLRALCMPYLGGASLAAVLADLEVLPPQRRRGRSLVEALERVQSKAPISLPTAQGGRFLEGGSYVEAVCWIGFCLAEALHYAHQRGLLHLDVKPSNVLLAADRQPMLLDFHLARAPLPAGAPADEWLGGTPGYMSPEQAAAVDAIRHRRPTTAAVDARSDIYSLGILLYEMLGGPVAELLGGPVAEPKAAENRPSLAVLNPHVPRSVQDLLGKCLRIDPDERYPDAAAVADELHRHLHDLPLRGVANRSLAERWRKWRRRKPQALPRLAAGAVLVTVLGGGELSFIARQAHEADRALIEGDELLRQHVFPSAIDRLRTGLDCLTYVPGHAALKHTLASRLALAKRRLHVDNLHRLVEQLRFVDVAEELPADVARHLDDGCREIWAARDAIVAQSAQSASDGSADASTEQVRTDLMDLAILWSGLRVQRADEARMAARRREAVQVLSEAEEAFGHNPVLELERSSHVAMLKGSDAQRVSEPSSDGSAPLTVWDHDALGRRWLHEGDLDAAADEFEKALDMAPDAFWPNFHVGVCRHRQGRHEKALQSFSVCVALKPTSAQCFYNRALAHAALDERKSALGDFGRALRCDPRFALAALHRATLYLQQRAFDLAAADLKRSAQLGADLGDVHYQWALLHLAQNDRRAALASLQDSLAHAPGHPDALSLLERLRPSTQEEE